ncbi:TMV resistance protein N-like [Neltuma alba]|uniref:TMV resistance protein N-like n=1 Tax=Neltuma alba TaxID=207710 RepID=UPI0010A36EF8|nr:TMV resistance protein N-like [Prosopis alba]
MELPEPVSFMCPAFHVTQIMSEPSRKLTRHSPFQSWRRNLFIFEERTVTNEAIIANSIALLDNLRQARCKFSGTSIPGASSHGEKHGWRPPPQCWTKLNVDGAFSTFGAISACGGLLRDATGLYIRGFLHRLDDGDALHAELWACLHGLKLAWDGGHRQVILESDSSSVLELISTHPDEHHDDFRLLKEIREMLDRDWEVQLQHVSRMHNRAADFLAKEGLKAISGFHLVVPAPVNLLPILDSDCNNTCNRRGLITDPELIDEIVKDVLVRVNDIYPCESNCLVGIDQHVDRIRSFLEMESKGVQILKIWGMSGIGKTAIARVAFEKFSSRYEGSYLVDNVREESQKHALKSLREKLISELQEEKSTFIHRKLVSRRKVLVVLDDVGAPEQLRHLVTEGFHRGLGSRVIATSQNKRALIAGGVHPNDILEVKKLDFEESLNLFSLNAFNNSHPERGYEELSKQAAAYANGLPLALKVLGLHLCSCDRETWKSTLGKLEMYPHPQIQDVLKMSFEGLDDVERDIFLDITFFCKGEDKDHVKRQLDANNLFATYGIKGLPDKALISISNNNVIKMHDLIQEMGWEIVRQECKDNPRGRSWLNDFEEVGIGALSGEETRCSVLNLFLSNHSFFFYFFR